LGKVNHFAVGWIPVSPKHAYRPATAAEHKAMSHPLRLRILRLCLDEPRTNRELADRLGANPATVLHHVRTLVELGFLEEQPPRVGRRGAREKPYKATGLSWFLTDDELPEDERFQSVLTMIDVLRIEVVESGPGSERHVSRLGLVLGDESADELNRRLSELVREFEERSPEPGGRRYGVFAAVHERD
jgi:DNA-binding transcriptional ArsR family regulator